MEMEVDIRRLKDFVNKELPNILMENSTDFPVAAFILQTMLNKLDELEELEER